MEQHKYRIILILICFFCLIVVTYTIGYNRAINSNICYDIHIPSSELIDIFCKENGYKFGWLDSHSCGINQVKCYKEFNDAKYYQCIDFFVKNGK